MLPFDAKVYLLHDFGDYIGIQGNKILIANLFVVATL